MRRKKKRKKKGRKTKPRQRVGGDRAVPAPASRLGSTSFWLSRKAKKTENKAAAWWKQPHGSLMLNNQTVGQLCRALMCETPIKRFARMVTKHFVFKYGLQVVLPNSINTAKVGWGRDLEISRFEGGQHKHSHKRSVSHILCAHLLACAHRNRKGPWAEWWRVCIPWW